MKKNKRKSEKSIGFTILTAGIAIVLLLTVAILVTTYSSFSTNTKNAVTSQVKELSSQIVYNYENYINTIIEVSNAIQIEADRMDLNHLQENQSLSQYFMGIIRLRNEILNISIYDSDTKLCLSSSDSEEIGRPVASRDIWFSEASSEETIHAFSVPYSDSNSENYKLNISKHINYGKGERSAILKIEISFSNFINLVKRSNFGQDGHITIIDSDYNIVYSSAGAMDYENELAIIQALTLGSQNAKIGEHNMSINVETLSNTKWRICVFINADQITLIEKNFIASIAIVSLLVLVVAVMTFSSVAKKITSPLKKLEETMLKIENADYFLLEEVNLHSGKEVVALSKSFNKMMKKLQELMDRVVFEQNAQRKSELKALQNQINPHFLYNTLDSIVWLIDNQKNEDASTMVVALAKLFRVGISKGNNVISAKDELDHVKNYLFIQSVRYRDCFSYEFHIDPAVYAHKTLKIMLQPLVENAIYHGLKNKIDKGEVLISGRVADGFLIFSVHDNGYGIKESKIQALYEQFASPDSYEGVGLKNIYQRLKIFYGEQAEFRIESVLDEGSTITIIQPIGDVE